MKKIEIDIEERLRHEAMVCRNPPIEYLTGKYGERVAHRPNPDYAMAELLTDAASVIERLRDALKDIADYEIDWSYSTGENLRHIEKKARAALETYK